MKVTEQTVALWVTKIKQESDYKSWIQDVLSLREFLLAVKQSFSDLGNIDDVIKNLPSVAEFLDVLCVRTDLLVDKHVTSTLHECLHFMIAVKPKTETEKISTPWAWKHVNYLLKQPVGCLASGLPQDTLAKMVQEKVSGITATLTSQYTSCNTVALSSDTMQKSADMTSAIDSLIPLLGTQFGDVVLQDLFKCTDTFHTLNCYSVAFISAVEFSLPNLSIKTCILFFERWPWKFSNSFQDTILKFSIENLNKDKDLNDEITQSKIVKCCCESLILLPVCISSLEEICELLKSEECKYDPHRMQQIFDSVLATLQPKLKEWGLETLVTRLKNFSFKKS
ncbi:uncharacterized protein LOC100180858 [Ciona intestinalis]